MDAELASRSATFWKTGERKLPILKAVSAPTRSPQRYWPSGSGRAGTRSVGCNPDKAMLSHEKQTAIKPRASRDRVFYPMNSNEELSAIDVASPTPANPHHNEGHRAGVVHGIQLIRQHVEASPKPVDADARDVDRPYLGH